MLNLLVPKEAFDAMPASAPGMPAFFAFFAAAPPRLPVRLPAAVGDDARGFVSACSSAKAWARIAFIALMAFGIAWNFAGLWLQHLMIQSMAAMTPPPEGGRARLRLDDAGDAAVQRRHRAPHFALYGWIAYKLTLPRIAASFPEARACGCR
jgi:hypothetical protein